MAMLNNQMGIHSIIVAFTNIVGNNTKFWLNPMFNGFKSTHFIVQKGYKLDRCSICSYQCAQQLNCLTNRLFMDQKSRCSA